MSGLVVVVIVSSSSREYEKKKKKNETELRAMQALIPLTQPYVLNAHDKHTTISRDN